MKTLLILFFASVFANAGLVNHVNVRVSSVEKHVVNVNACSQGSQNFLIIGLRPTSGAISYVYVSTAEDLHKDIESIALTALSTGLLVTAQADDDISLQVCSISGGKLRFISIQN